jgi:cytochrome P450
MSADLSSLSLEEVFATEEFILDPYPTYQRLLAEAPVWRSPHNKIFVSSHALVTEVLGDYERFPQPEDPNPSFHALNPPDHTRMRRLVSTAFTPRATERQRDRIAAIVDDLVTKIEAGVVDLKQALSIWLPTRMITGMLGVPLEDGELWEEWADALHAATSEPRFLPEQEERVTVLRAKAREAAHEEREYFRALVRQRQANPGNDLISELANVREGVDRLDEDELVTTLVLLLGGGHHTSISLISSCVYWLLRNPDQYQLIRNDPSLIPAAVEETIRYDSPLQSVDRLVGDKPVVLGGETIDPGTRITLLLSAANRDPAMFEDPDAFRVNRENSKRHASFGLGVHFCLGAPLARAEGEEALRGLLGRFDSISLVEGDDVEYAPSYTLRDFVKVPVRLEESVA